MKSRLRLFFILLNFPILIYSQTYRIPKTELLHFLYQQKSSIPDITSIDPTHPLLPINDSKLLNHRHKLIKTETGLFVLIDQTGRVYKAKNETKEKIEFTRIDSTYYWGYNGSSIDFNFKDTLFSFGGGGFWRINGQLRYYSTVFNEWNISPISEEIPTYDYINYLSIKTSNLFYIQRPFDDAVTGKHLYDWRLLKLNLNSKDNISLGEFSPPLLDIFKNYSLIKKINLPSLDGLLVFFTFENILLLKFNENAVYKLNNKKIKDLILGNSTAIQIRNNFEVGDSVYYTLSNDSIDKLHSFKITQKDFTKEPFPIFVQNSNSKYLLWLIIGLTSLLSALLVWFLFKKRECNHTSSKIESEQPLITDPNSFSFIEMNLIDQIILCNENGTNISGEQLNNILGVSKKSIETQKKVRGDTINRINHKFKITFAKEINLIERTRTENDRRFYNYIISKENALIYKEKYKFRN